MIPRKNILEITFCSRKKKCSVCVCVWFALNLSSCHQGYHIFKAGHQLDLISLLLILILFPVEEIFNFERKFNL